jgi:hypothetical protein
MTRRVVRVERSIPAAPSDVWAVLADLPNHASWRKDVKTSRMLGEETSGVGARRHLDLAPGRGTRRDCPRLGRRQQDGGRGRQGNCNAGQVGRGHVGCG